MTGRMACASPVGLARRTTSRLTMPDSPSANGDIRLLSDVLTVDWLPTALVPNHRLPPVGTVVVVVEVVDVDVVGAIVEVVVVVGGIVVVVVAGARKAAV